MNSNTKSLHQIARISRILRTNIFWLKDLTQKIRFIRAIREIRG